MMPYKSRSIQRSFILPIAAMLILSLSCIHTADAKVFLLIQSIRKTYASMVDIEASAKGISDDGPDGKKLESVTRTGVGIIIDDKGTIVTNAHIVNGMTEISATLNNGKKISAKLVRAYPQEDIAFLKIRPSASILSVMPIYDSSTLKKGSEVFTVGNSRFLKKTTIHGKVIDFITMKSKTSKFAELTNIIRTQFDAHAYSGDSGSPVFDNRARFVGILFAALKESTYFSFVLPSNLIKKHYNELLLHRLL